MSYRLATRSSDGPFFDETDTGYACTYHPHSEGVCGKPAQAYVETSAPWVERFGRWSRYFDGTAFCSEHKEQLSTKETK